MKTAKKKPLYNYSGNVINGKLCRECMNNKGCKDTKCPVWKWRQQQSQQ